MRIYFLFMTMAFICLFASAVFAQNLNPSVFKCQNLYAPVELPLKSFFGQNIKLIFLAGRQRLISPGLEGKYWNYYQWDRYYREDPQIYKGNPVLGEYRQKTIYVGQGIRFCKRIDFYLIIGPYRTFAKNNLYLFAETGLRIKF